MVSAVDDALDRAAAREASQEVFGARGEREELEECEFSLFGLVFEESVRV